MLPPLHGRHSENRCQAAATLSGYMLHLMSRCDSQRPSCMGTRQGNTYGGSGFPRVTSPSFFDRGSSDMHLSYGTLRRSSMLATLHMTDLRLYLIVSVARWIPDTTPAPPPETPIVWPGSDHPAHISRYEWPVRGGVERKLGVLCTC